MHRAHLAAEMQAVIKDILYVKNGKNPFSIRIVVDESSPLLVAPSDLRGLSTFASTCVAPALIALGIALFDNLCESSDPIVFKLRKWSPGCEHLIPHRPARARAHRYLKQQRLRMQSNLSQTSPLYQAAALVITLSTTPTTTTTTRKDEKNKWTFFFVFCIVICSLEEGRSFFLFALR